MSARTSRQEPMLSFIRRWEKKLGRETDGSQKSELSAADLVDPDQEQDSPAPASIPTSGLSRTPRRSSRAATKLKSKAHSISKRLTRKSRSPAPSVMEDEIASQRACAQQVLGFFPDIRPQHLQEVARSLKHDPEAVINFIADELEKGKPYPKATTNSGKRKRGDDEEDEDEDEHDEEMARVKRRFDTAGRRAVKKSEKHVAFITKLIIRDFPFAKPKYVEDLLEKNDQLLLPTYLELEETIRDWDNLPQRPWIKNFDSASLRGVSKREDEELKKALEKCSLKPMHREEIEEMQGARLVRSFRDRRRKSKEDGAQRKASEQEASRLTGQMAECQCCCGEEAIANMVHCNGEKLHVFCITCARRNAETAVGMSKHELSCMAMEESCPAGFSHTQRQRFLDKKLAAALDRIEANYIIALAALEDLEKCPFCDYAAEYPPVAVNRVFVCEDKKCLKRSCRLCHKEDHLPLTCEEFAKENGYSARRAIEEARSEAVIRRCNKCKQPFIKEMGCNKMTCPVVTCKNVQCYICSESCTYEHFSKTSGCVLYDNIEARHDIDLRRAEDGIRKRILEENPGITEDQLTIEMSAHVRKDDANRRAKDANAPHQANIYWEDFRAARANGVDLQALRGPAPPPVALEADRPPARPAPANRRRRRNELQDQVDEMNLVDAPDHWNPGRNQQQPLDPHHPPQNPYPADAPGMEQPLDPLARHLGGLEGAWDFMDPVQYVQLLRAERALAAVQNPPVAVENARIRQAERAAQPAPLAQAPVELNGAEHDGFRERFGRAIAGEQPPRTRADFRRRAEELPNARQKVEGRGQDQQAQRGRGQDSQGIMNRLAQQLNQQVQRPREPVHAPPRRGRQDQDHPQDAPQRVLRNIPPQDYRLAYPHRVLAPAPAAAPVQEQPPPNPVHPFLNFAQPYLPNFGGNQPRTRAGVEAAGPVLDPWGPLNFGGELPRGPELFGGQAGGPWANRPQGGAGGH